MSEALGDRPALAGRSLHVGLIPTKPTRPAFLWRSEFGVRFGSRYAFWARSRADRTTPKSCPTLLQRTRLWVHALGGKAPRRCSVSVLLDVLSRRLPVPEHRRFHPSTGEMSFDDKWVIDLGPVLQHAAILSPRGFSLSRAERQMSIAQLHDAPWPEDRLRHNASSARRIHSRH